MGSSIGLLRKSGRWMRGTLFPIRNMPVHMSTLASRSAGEMGARAEVIKMVERAVLESCEESGLASLQVTEAALR